MVKRDSGTDSAVARALASNVRARRLALDLSQVELAELAGFDPATCKRIEGAKHGARLTVLDGLGRALGVEPWKLVKP